MNFFLIAVLAVGILLLFIPVIGMLVDIFYNHTMTINLSDMAMYIGAVAAIFASGGLTSAWTEFSYSKYDIPPNFPLSIYARSIVDNAPNKVKNNA